MTFSFSAPTFFLVFYDIRLLRERLYLVFINNYFPSFLWNAPTQRSTLSLSFGTNQFPCFMCSGRRATLSYRHRPFSSFFYDMRLHRERLSLFQHLPYSSFFIICAYAESDFLISASTIFLVFMLCSCSESDFLFFGIDYLSCFCLMSLRREWLSLFQHQPFSLFFYDMRLRRERLSRRERRGGGGVRSAGTLPLQSVQASAIQSQHRAGRVLISFSSRRNWDFSTLLPAGKCAPPPFGSGGGGHTRLREREWGSPNFDEGTVVLYIYILYVLCKSQLQPQQVPTEKLSTEESRNSVVFHNYSLVYTSSLL